MVAERPGDDPESDVPPDVATGAAAAAGRGAGRADALAGRSAALAARLADHLDGDERVRVAWVVRRDAPAGSAGSVRRDGADAATGPVPGEGSQPGADRGRRTLYAATDRRLLAVGTDGRVRSTPFARRPAADPALTLGVGLVVAILAFLGGVAAASGWTALLLVATCVGGLALAERGWHRWRAPGADRGRPETAVAAAAVAESAPGDGPTDGIVRGPPAGGESAVPAADPGVPSPADDESAAGDDD